MEGGKRRKYEHTHNAGAAAAAAAATAATVVVVVVATTARAVILPLGTKAHSRVNIFSSRFPTSLSHSDPARVGTKLAVKG